MRMGLREFRERLSEVAEGAEPVVVTSHDRVIGIYTPSRTRLAKQGVDTAKLITQTAEWQREWKARTPDWRERLIAMGITEEEDLRGLDAAL